MTDKRTRVLFMIPTLTAGGAERVMVTILRHLDRTRFTATLAVMDTRNAAFMDELPSDIDFVDLQCPRVRYALPALVKVIRRHRPDVVLSTLGQLNLAIGALRPLLPKARYIARETIVVSADAATKRWPWVWAAAHRHFYRRFDAIICNSDSMKDDLVRHFGITPDKAVVIHNPVDVARVRELAKGAAPAAANAESLRLVAIGRLTQQKGFDLLIDAIALCRQRALHVTILGEGPMRKELESRAASKGVEHRVAFRGFEKNPYPFLAQADAFVLSSRYEGFPNVVLEALACGTPVIALPGAGGTREIVESVPGCVIARDVSAESLAQAIEAFSPGVRIEPAVVQPYDAPAITRLYEEAFMKDSVK